MSPQYQHKDFVYSLSNRSSWCKVNSNGGYTDSEAKSYFWNTFQSEILPELQKELDSGWEPITEVGPAAVSLHVKKEYFFDWGCMGWFIYVIGGLVSFGVGFILIPLFWVDWIARPSKVQVKLRRKS